MIDFCRAMSSGRGRSRIVRRNEQKVVSFLGSAKYATLLASSRRGFTFEEVIAFGVTMDDEETASLHHYG